MGVSFSPMPSTNALSPPTKNGTSAPSGVASSSRRARGQSRFHSRLSASSTVAASELPPPMPAPQGTFFSTEMSAPKPQPLACCSARAARRLRSSAGRGRAESRRAEVVPAQQAVVTALDVQRVGPVDQDEDGLQQVVAVGPSSRDVQEQVQL